ncbi:hypothetical protein Patl1_30528 [Pistacia atlantica]|uniref:Uncharacterized protein n=1 Tax=Pistacia atlantica TaxID=434234 RepID=A0ACC1AEN8_9ROSI|nr:hypothetical protein Patl1_30528 [Pistacia atlantica]
MVEDGRIMGYSRLGYSEFDVYKRNSQRRLAHINYGDILKNTVTNLSVWCIHILKLRSLNSQTNVSSAVKSSPQFKPISAPMIPCVRELQGLKPMSSKIASLLSSVWTIKKRLPMSLKASKFGGYWVKTLPKDTFHFHFTLLRMRRDFTSSRFISHRDLITGSYISHVLDEGKATTVRNRQRKLYSNNPSKNWHGWKATKWSHVHFEHPATFDTLAMERKKKEDIKKDLKKFSESKEYYKKIGKAWKRGYLLYGPPGTENTELRNLLIETSSKSIIVLEDIDCSLDLTGQRKKKKEKNEEEEETDPIKKKQKEMEKEKDKSSKVTLSGLLNFFDGLWSACGGERIIVFTTNFVDKLDPALIRRGRMDKHIEMSYCSFEAFKVLAENYLNIEGHELYEEIERMLAETDMTPADVAENLMPKSDEEDAESCLKNLIEALEVAKEEATKTAEEEARLKAEKEEKEKEKSAEENVNKEEETSGNKG